eukprot:GHVU01122507.1.p2 GENE.GHVU01122507.1~~GHVU01122507.1.p2  ORF type:complete len:170 (+),score=4.20 GHVU01122507.1:1833-2342(+)
MMSIPAMKHSDQADLWERCLCLLIICTLFSKLAWTFASSIAKEALPFIVKASLKRRMRHLSRPAAGKLLGDMQQTLVPPTSPRSSQVGCQTLACPSTGRPSFFYCFCLDTSLFADHIRYLVVRHHASNLCPDIHRASPAACRADWQRPSVVSAKVPPSLLMAGCPFDAT